MKRGDFLNNNKRGQVTVFIIAAIAIVGLSVLIYLLRPAITVTSGFDEENPKGFIQTCMEEDINNAVSLVSSQGGSINPEGFLLYKDDKLEYLCYTTQDCRTCIVQEPRLVDHIESEIKKDIQGNVGNCFSELKKSYEDKGYSVVMSGNQNSTKVELLPKRIVTRFDYNLTATKGDSKKYENFTVVLNNNLYELSSIANSIIDWESLYGDADPGYYMGLYPDLKVEKANQDEGSTVYIITDRNTGSKFQFASRSIVWPAGYSCQNIASNS